ncbi:MAG: N-acetylmuramic acid 6-phosphate etherase [Chloroflexi bacterium]|nr:N-acetylmuramic acid 6-phosphate etherase [Chloroflexota bacterium]
MSGTSADGIDAALVEISGAPPALTWKLIHHHHAAYPPELQNEILACASRETGTIDRVCALNVALGEQFADAAINAARAAHVALERVDLIGSHGQTVWHIPGRATLQIGDAAIIAEKTGVTTISNFRARDIAAGGQGAPLVAYVDVLLFSDTEKIRVAQNIGGIANLTFLPKKFRHRETENTERERKKSWRSSRLGGEIYPIAFDSGPGNALIDDATRRATNGAQACDENGALAARGRVNEKLLNELLAHAYFKTPPPKTTGREMFGAALGAEIWARARDLRGEDIIATLTALTADSIARAYRDFLPQFPDEIILSGGGARNPTLVARLREKIQPARLILSDEFGLPVEAKEAFAFAILAYESAHHRAGNLPSATGAKRAVVLGEITPAYTSLRAERSNPQDTSEIALLRPSQPQKPLLAMTESINPATENIDALSTLEIVRAINREDARVADAVAVEIENIARAVDEITTRLQNGGRLIYVGAGTSGRLGILDAVEMPPTFSTPPDVVIGLIAGGHAAMFRAVEGAEDDRAQGARDLAALNVNEKDSVVGLSASGGAPYVLGALAEANARGALTISVAANDPAPIHALAAIQIAARVGAEVIAGSTRLKAGTAQKMILNLISTAVMIRLGKTYGNLMVDLQATNEKLRARAIRIVDRACNLPRADAEKLLRACDGEVKTAIVAHLARVSPEIARARLNRAKGVVRAALS